MNTLALEDAAVAVDYVAAVEDAAAVAPLANVAKVTVVQH